jgi:hypothetical protein
MGVGALTLSDANPFVASVAVLVSASLMAALFEAMVAEWRGKISPRVVAGQTVVPLLFIFPAALFLSWFVPLAVWLLAVALIYLVRSGSTAESTVGRAWIRASILFENRRSALGKHYRWRVMLASTPYLIYGFSSMFVMVAVTGYAMATLGLAGGSPETAVLGFLFGTIALGIALLVALPAGLGVGGLILSPFVRGPYINLLRALWPDPLPDEQWGLGCASSLFLLLADLLVIGLAFTWAGSTFIGSAFPGGGSTASLMQLPFVVGSVAVRALLGDAFLMHANHPLKSPLDVIRAVFSAPKSLFEAATFQLGVLIWVFVIPLFFCAGGVLLLFLLEYPPVLPITVGVVCILGMGYLGAATSLRLTLHRLVLVDDVLDPKKPS